MILPRNQDSVPKRSNMQGLKMLHEQSFVSCQHLRRPLTLLGADWDCIHGPCVTQTDLVYSLSQVADDKILRRR
ncbi:Uncharacterized protein TCM_034710 [Theobroma cacao]|uniref:Uncharacterized protein n=1 Tax=Theobroma cacao TaxID=3641 RepID=A0A061FFR8_THECC|nr:Uncharacterized protein TCM_034710 [Theobroma cacao]